jgi:hypothetical protein
MAHGPGHLEQQQPAEPTQLISCRPHADAPNTGAPGVATDWASGGGCHRARVLTPVPRG